MVCFVALLTFYTICWAISALVLSPAVFTFSDPFPVCIFVIFSALTFLVTTFQVVHSLSCRLNFFASFFG